jgi:hypothetical protein
VTLGLVASQRTEGDTDLIDPKMVTRAGLRWYKNRVIMNYDMDGKNPFHAVPANRDGERAMLTMSYVVSGTLMIVPSFGRMSPEQWHDLSRLYPYHQHRRSARPVDAFVSDLPRIYDLRIAPDWSQTALFNFDTSSAARIEVPLSGDPASGSLGLDPAKQYYAYDFWNDRLAGKWAGSATLAQELRPGEARMLSVREVKPHPQVLSTNRHLMQGYVDLLGCGWNAGTRELEGVAAAVADETYRIVIATNGFTPQGAGADDEIENSIARSKVGHKKNTVSVKVRELAGGLAEILIDRTGSGPVAWKVTF